MNKNPMRGGKAGRADASLRSPYPSRAEDVDWAIARGKRLELPQEICSAVVAKARTRGVERQPEGRAEVSRGHSSRASDEGLNELER